MPFDSVLVFDIESEYGHFRKFNTTTSPLTYSIPTRPAIAGLLGAILGVEREMAAGKFREGAATVADLFAKEKAGMAVQILSPVNKVNIAFNLLDTEKTASSFFNVKQRTQIEFELLKHPRFRVFASFTDPKIFDELADRLQRNQSHFSPYLGLSQFTAITRFEAVATVRSLETTESTPVITAINLNQADREDPVQFNRSIDFKYTADTMPVAMQKDRVVTEYAEVIMETNGNPVNVRSGNILQVPGYGNILFL